jgi:predicted flap endonuclease-1-like 5' DNA nuclease
MRKNLYDIFMLTRKFDFNFLLETYEKPTRTIHIMTKLTDVEGIGDIYSEKLKNAGISTTEALLEACSSKKGREETSEKTEISQKLITSWANRADLSRVNGVSTQYADLLEYAGVDTVPELAQRNSENLTAKMIEINDAKNLVRKVPTVSQTQSWIDQAKDLPRVMTY